MKTQMILLSEIVHKFDVRTAIDEDRVIQFATLYEEGVQLPPIKVMELPDGKYAYVDGRHRGLGRAFLDLPDIEAIIVKYDDPADIYAEALRSNWGGSKPPSRADISYTINRMLESGVSQRAIFEKLDFLSKGSVRAFVETAKGNITRKRVSGALEAVANGLPVHEAASKFKVRPEMVKDAIAGRKKKWGGDHTQEAETLNLFKTYISKTLGTANKGIGKKMDNLLKQVEDGDLSPAGVQSLIQAWHEHLRKTMLRIDDWRARVDALGSSTDKLFEGQSTVSPVTIREIRA